jgi:hypothetical protein
MAMKRQKAIPKSPVRAGRRDSCLRSVPISSRYIDLPEHPELRSCHLNRADRELSRKNPFTCNSPSVIPSLQHLPIAHIDFRVPPAFESAGRRVNLSFSSMPKRSSELRQSLGSGPLARLQTSPAEALKKVRFLRGMEEVFSTSPFFGIPLLKRLS